MSRPNRRADAWLQYKKDKKNPRQDRGLVLLTRRLDERKPDGRRKQTTECIGRWIERPDGRIEHVENHCKRGVRKPVVISKTRSADYPYAIARKFTGEYRIDGRGKRQAVFDVEYLGTLHTDQDGQEHIAITQGVERCLSVWLVIWNQNGKEMKWAVRGWSDARETARYIRTQGYEVRLQHLDGNRRRSHCPSSTKGIFNRRTRSWDCHADRVAIDRD